MAKKQTQFGICKLCGQTAELLNSHIVPKFIIRQSGLLGAGFSIVCVSDKSFTQHNRQDAIKEYLLCLACESRLSILEDYAARQIYGKDSPFQNLPSNGIIWTGLDYTKMKLFTTSILWRMSISSHDFYKTVSLGGRHESIIREMLLNNNPGEIWRYGCNIAYLHYGGKPLGDGIFSQPQRCKMKSNRNYYRFILSKFLVYINASLRSPFGEQTQYLQLDGSWPVPTIEALAVPFVKEEIDTFRANSALYPRLD